MSKSGSLQKRFSALVSVDCCPSGRKCSPYWTQCTDREDTCLLGIYAC